MDTTDPDAGAAWAAAVARMPLPAAVVDANDRVTATNAAAAALVGRELQSLLAGTDRFGLEADSAREIARLLGDARARGEALERDIVVHPENSDAKCFRIYATPTDTGHVCLLAVDTTAARAAERSRQSLGQRIELLLENDGSAVAAYDRDGRLVFLNSVAAANLGGTPRDLVGKKLDELFPPDRAAGYVARLREVFDTGHATHHDDRLELPEGARWFHTLQLPERGPDGSVQTVVVIGRDVTEQRRAERASTEAAARLEQVLDDARASVLSLDDQGRVLFANRNAARSWHPTGDQLVGQRLDLAVPTDEARALVAHAKTVFETGIPAEHDTHRDGGRWIRSVLHTERDTDGTTRSVVVISRDVTELRDLESQLLRADRASMLGTLAASVVHELSNPLAAISANVELLAADPDRTDRDRMLDDTMLAADQLRRMVRDISVFMRGKDATSSASAAVSECVAHVRRMLDNQLSHRAQLTVAVPRGLRVAMDAARLNQVLTNLVINALQSFADDQPLTERTIRIEARRDREHVSLSVADTGPGMTPEVAERALDPFFTTKAVGAGTGLGLAICKRLVEAAGGQLSIESRSGAGTTVRLTLNATSRPATKSSDQLSAVRPCTRQKVLVVDDEPSNLRAVRRILGSDHDVTVAASAKEALARIESDAPRVVLTDYMMPDMNGADLYRAIQRDHPELAPRVGFITGGAFDSPGRAFLDTHAERTVYKPYTRQQLTDLVVQLASRR